MHIGLVSLPLSGHMNPFLAVARALQGRGHRVTYFGPPDCAPACDAAGIDFACYGQAEFPPGAVAETWGAVASMHGMRVLEHATAEISPRLLHAALADLPGAVEKADVEALVLDPVFFYVELVPLSLRLPYVQLFTVVQLDPSGSTPPSLFPWPHETKHEARARNLQGMQQVGTHIAASLPIASEFAARHNLTIDWTDPGALVSRLAVISPMPAQFDFPGIAWPPTFHYTGPMVDDAGRAPTPFPWERLDGRPLIYASLGTLNNGVLSIHHAILSAAAKLPNFQMVFVIGNNVRLEDIGPIPDNVIVVTAAPQIELLRRAALCITHAGINTTLECLAQGVPMVAIPIGYDQPGAAVRIAYHGVGEFLTVEALTSEALLELLQRVLAEPGYRRKAAEFGKLLAGINGRQLAADIIEQAFTGRS